MRFWIFIVLFFAFTVYGQEYRSSISSNEVKVGDLFTLTYSVIGSDRFPDEIYSDQVFPAVLLSSDSLKNNSKESLVEIVKVTDTLLHNGDTVSAVRSYNLMVWDSCALSLVGFKYSYEGLSFQFPPCFINVSYYDSEENVPIKDIKEYFNDWKPSRDVHSKITNYWPYLIGFLFLLAAVFVFVWLRIRAQKRGVYFQKTLQEMTLDQIEFLRREELWKKDHLKQHFVRFSHILRSYLTDRFELSFLDKTTEQSKLILEGLSMDRDLKENILELLNSADMIKFADSSIDDVYIAVLFDQLITIVNKTSQIPEES